MFQNPEILIDITTRPLSDGDEEHFTVDMQNNGLVEKNIPICHVAANNEDIPC